ncbi:Transcription-repair-coupling factor [Brevundimonas sp. NIBR10]|uniref:DEAD/DEAH box helicase n=1 Tax=Brevundimonas sp. NIBR10 TaxID=3015997 RepID=UPI0022F1B475|nr:DEAD/DEAH box helicase [Brevundimonas sp. NIBR10]WGM47109.1 Transcription-repair-coupling factor [Brevundimonas sp. NIBR10]
MVKTPNDTIIGETALIDAPAVKATDRGASRRPGPALTAAVVAARGATAGLTVVISTSETRADELGRALAAMAGVEAEVMVLPPWDCLLYDHASPSRDCQGRRLEVLVRLGRDGAGVQILVVSPEAAMQRLPPLAARDAAFVLTAGDRLDREVLEAFARRTGYVVDDRIDEPGEIAILGEVVDVFPASAARPVRVTLVDDRIDTMRWFDPLSQRSDTDVETLTLRGASERYLADDETREPGCEHRLGHTDGPLQTLFDLCADAVILAEAGAGDRCIQFLDQVREAYVTARTFGDSTGLPTPTSLYLATEEAEKALIRATLVDTGAEAAAAEVYALRKSPGRALKNAIEERREQGRRVVISGLGPELKMIQRLLKRQGVDLPPASSSWHDMTEAASEEVLALEADLGVGFDAPQLGITLITASDVLGGRVAQGTAAAESVIGEPELRPGDVVIHEDHGLGVLQALERIEIDGFERDVIRLGYYGGATVLAPVEEFGRIWRYGSEPAALTLDRLGSDGWLRRRAEVSSQIDRTAARLVEVAAERDAERLEPMTPPRQAYARFAAGFPFPESVDQAAAIAAVMEDLSGGRAMNRLVCGDVGFGKTEVALRAAAAVTLAGRQVLVTAPTTVLARQHFETFRRRFRDTELQVAHLSRLVEPAEAAAVKAGLADGSIRIVVGTQALAAETIAFADLGLVVIDEEQRFGTKLKDSLRARAAHCLTMTATPIPRTLQSALVGLLDVSVIASPPARRRPIRTTLTEFDGASLRTALLREKRRGGQSFVVCPRIEDLEPMTARLARLVPELSVRTAHGRMPVADVDAAMVGFADGEGDILLATNIIESGLDVPRANTIVVWRPDRFGLAQLHQLRGRVGRGRAQGFAYLLTEPDDAVGEGTLARLATLEAFDRLGSGFAISARDLDLRGGGDLAGDDQAGHMKLIGAALYQQVLERAVRLARGETPVEALPHPRVDAAACLPVEYIPDATMRINLYARLARVASAGEVEALEDEIADRFGPLPDPVAGLLSTTRLSALAAEAGVTRIASGPKATAFDLAPARAAALRDRLPANEARRWVEDRLVYAARKDVTHDQHFIAAVLSDLAA